MSAHFSILVVGKWWWTQALLLMNNLLRRKMSNAFYLPFPNEIQSPAERKTEEMINIGSILLHYVKASQLLCDECAPGQYGCHFAKRFIDTLLIATGE
jgi:hypothetical protein